jgi:hypothetical protein
MKTAGQRVCLLVLLAAQAGRGAGWMAALEDAGGALHGFAEVRQGLRTQSDPLEDSATLNELRLQVDRVWYRDRFTAQFTADAVYDALADDRGDIDLETGAGWFDLRQAYLLASPLPWMDVKLGRQVLTWGTGDLLFINDLFPKDWPSFLLGRDDAYLKAPSDALLVSLFPDWVSIDIAYTPRFDADRFVSGERISYWDGQGPAGRNAVVDPLRPDDWFSDGEAAVRLYRYLGAHEAALYAYRGFWKSPGGIDPASGRARFPELGVFGASLRGPFAGGIASLEAGYYDSAEDRGGNNPFCNNSEARVLAGYEREIVRNVTLGVQYYLERMLDHGAYRRALDDAGLPADSARDEDRHTVTARVTWLLLNQNLVLNCFVRYAPSDADAYLKPVLTYAISDRWRASAGANVFLGEEPYTFLGQFENNSSIHASLRCSY